MVPDGVGEENCCTYMNKGLLKYLNQKHMHTSHYRSSLNVTYCTLQIV